MAEELPVTLPNGGRIVITTPAVPAGSGNVGFGPVNAPARVAVGNATEAFEGALHSLAGVAEALDKAVGEIARRPSKTEIEFSASFTGTLDLKLLKGDANAEFKVTLTWGDG